VGLEGKSKNHIPQEFTSIKKTLFSAANHEKRRLRCNCRGGFIAETTIGFLPRENICEEEGE